MYMKLMAEPTRDLRARREQMDQLLAGVHASPPHHIHDHDLERYHLGMVKDEAELADVEEHLLWCSGCIDRTAATADYVDAVRAASCNLRE
jgi:hypothetical protein